MAVQQYSTEEVAAFFGLQHSASHAAFLLACEGKWTTLGELQGTPFTGTVRTSSGLLVVSKRRGKPPLLEISLRTVNINGRTWDYTAPIYVQANKQHYMEFFQFDRSLLFRLELYNPFETGHSAVLDVRTGMP